MTMYAIYFVHPETGVKFPATSGSRMDFSAPEGAPALFASAKNALKCLRDYKRSAIDHYAAQGYRQYLAEFVYCPDLQYPVPGIENMENFIIVPMIISPDFDNIISFTAK